MEKIISVLSKSPLYFTMTLREWHGLVKRLQAKKTEIDTGRHQLKVSEFIKTEELHLPKAFWGGSPFDKEPSGS